MKKIIAMIKPFDMTQNLLVYEDGNKIDMLDTTIDNLEKDLFILINKHDLYQIDFCGPKQYSKGLVKKIENNTEFAQKDLIINYI